MEADRQSGGIEYHGQSGGQSWVSLGSIKAQSGVSPGLIGTIQVGLRLVRCWSGLSPVSVWGSIRVSLESSGVGRSRFDPGSVQAQSRLSPGSV